MQASLFKDYGDYLAHAIDNLNFPEKPKDLYEAVSYIFSLGGKRLRPALCLFSAEAFGSDKSAALPAALCVETFHNFSLIHDDIMDAAPLRRKAQTVHEKWNTNTAILSGDLALIIAYRFLESYRDERFFKLYNRFNQTAIEVCEGQQMDMLFEQQTQVSVDEYLQMISYKTAVLLGCSLAMGAIVAGAEDTQVQHCYDIGLMMGEAFQLQDDFLDTYGSQAHFGKNIGGDILANKKTILYVLALKNADDNTKKQLLKLFSTNDKTQTKIDRVTQLYNQLKVPQAVEAMIEDKTNIALGLVDELAIDAQYKDVFRTFIKTLTQRQV